jgi:hypothetical protein
MRTIASWLCVLAAVVATATGARAAASVTLTISPTSQSWTVDDFVNQFLAPTNGPIVVTGTMKSAAGAGSHAVTIGVSSPADITGSHVTNIIPISAFSMTCSGVGNAPAATYTGAHTVLVASSTTDCASWSVAASTTITVDFDIDLFLDDRTFKADSYTSAGFAIVGSAV